MAQTLGFDYCLVLDSDEFITELNLKAFQNSLQNKDPAYKIKQTYDQTYHLPYYRLHTTKARHKDRHQQCFLNDNQIFLESIPTVEGLTVRHDKIFRPKEREKYNKIFYEANPVR